MFSTAPPTTILLGLPTRDGTLSKETECSITHNDDGFNLIRIMTSGLGVIDARNSIAAGMMDHSDDPEQVCLWCDSDSFWEPGTIAKVIEALKSLPPLSTVNGYSGSRREHGTSFGHISENGWQTAVYGREPELCPIIRAGFQLVAHRLAVLQALPSDPFNYYEPLAEKDWYPPSEDYSFFERLRLVGGQAYMALSAPVAHVDVETGLAYLPHSGAFMIVDNQLVPYVRPRYKTYAEFAAAKGVRHEPKVRTY